MIPGCVEPVQNRQSAALLVWLEGFILVLAAPILLFPERWPGVTLGVLLLLALVWLPQPLLLQAPWSVTPLNGALLLFVLTLGIGVAVTPLPDLTLPKATGLILGLGTFHFLTHWISTRSRLLAALLGWSLAGAGILIVGVLAADWGTKVPALQLILGRLPSLEAQIPGAPDAGISPNQLAGTLTLYLPLSVLGVLGWRPRGQHLFVWLLLLASMLALLGVLVLTQSRAGWVGSVAGLAALAVLTGITSGHRRVRWGTTVALSFFLLAAVGAILLLGGLDATAEVLYSSGTGNTLEEMVGEVTMEARVEIWNRALYAIADFPFTGCGLGAFRDVVWRLYPLFLIRPGYDIAHAHNIFLQTALDLGIPGLIAYLALLIIALVICWRVIGTGDQLLRSIALGLAAGLVGLHVYGMGDAVALGSKPGFTFWMALTIIAVLPRIQCFQEASV